MCRTDRRLRGTQLLLLGDKDIGGDIRILVPPQFFGGGHVPPVPDGSPPMVLGPCPGLRPWPLARPAVFFHFLANFWPVFVHFVVSFAVIFGQFLSVIWQFLASLCKFLVKLFVNLAELFANLAILIIIILPLQSELAMFYVWCQQNTSFQYKKYRNEENSSVMHSVQKLNQHNRHSND